MFLATYGEDDVVAQSVLHEVLANVANVDARDANGKTAEDWATDLDDAGAIRLGDERPCRSPCRTPRFRCKLRSPRTRARIPSAQVAA